MYDLYWERQEILGSGSDFQFIKSVKTFDEAIREFNSHKCNRIEKTERINGRIVVRVYDRESHSFE